MTLRTWRWGYDMISAWQIIPFFLPIILLTILKNSAHHSHLVDTLFLIQKSRWVHIYRILSLSLCNWRRYVIFRSNDVFCLWENELFRSDSEHPFSCSWGGLYYLHASARAEVHSDGCSTKIMPVWSPIIPNYTCAWKATYYCSNYASIICQALDMIMLFIFAIQENWIKHIPSEPLR